MENNTHKMYAMVFRVVAPRVETTTVFATSEAEARKLLTAMHDESHKLEILDVTDMETNPDFKRLLLMTRQMDNRDIPDTEEGGTPPVVH